MGEADGYGNLPGQIADVRARLEGHPDDAVKEDVRRLVGLTDDFHRIGLSRLLATIQQWRGEIFLEALQDDPVVSTLLSAHGLPSTEL